MASIQIQKYAAAPGARVIIETEDGAPVLAVKSLGKGRVATFAWRSPALTPEMPGGPAYRYWEPVYSLMNRAVAWAAGRDFTRQGRPQVVETPEAHRDPSLSARVWRNPAGEVTDWELVFVPPGAGPVASIEIDAPRNVLRGEDIIVSFAVPADADEVRAELIERVEGSVRTVETHRRCPVKLVSEGDRRVYEATLPSSRIRQTMAFARVTAMKSGAVAALGEAEVVVAPRYAEGENRWQDYEVLMWPVDSLPFLQDYDDRLIREMGCTGVMTTRWNSASNRMRWARAGLRMMPHEIRGSSLHFRNWSEIVANWNTSRDRKWLVRNPSFADKDFLARERRIVADAVKAIAPFNPTNYVLADEPSITSYTADFDYDFHPANIEWFRRELEARFGTVENMNAALGTSAGSFDAVEPPITEDARKAGQWGLWNEWRRHNDFVMAEGYRMYLDEVRKADPNGTISVSGTQTATAFDGFDWGRLSPLFGTMQGYGYGYQDNKRMSFNPDMLNATPAGYGRSGRAVHHQVWSKLADHGAGHVIFWWIAFRNPDFTFCNSAKDYQEAFSEMRRGIGRQFMQARRRMSPVAVIYSMNSMRAAYAEGKMQNRSGEFPSTESSVSGAIIAAGFDPLFVTDEQVAAGELEKKGVKALFLPMTLSLGRGDKAGGLAVAPAIEAFLDRGGLVVATHDFRYDEFLQRRDAPESITGRIVKLGEVKDDLAAAIGRSGAAPFATLRGPDGAAIPHASLFVHRLQGDVEAHIVTALRPPLGSKEVLGADGVIHSVPDDTGGSEVEPAALDLSGFGRVTAYDMRSGGVLKQTGGKVTFDMRAGDGFPVAVLPYTAKSLAVTAARRDRTLVVEWRLRGNARVYAPHVMHISTTDSRGAVVPALTLNAVTGPDGAGSVAIPLSWEEEFIALNVSVRDALTGLTGSAKP